MKRFWPLFPLIAVLACDGGSPVLPANSGPVVTITAPLRDTTVWAGDRILFSGSAVDAEDGDLGGAIQWGSDRDGSLGRGRSTETSALSPGSHTITARVTDADGETGVAGVRVQVETEVVQNGVPTVIIMAPSQDTTVTAGDAVTLTATASDLEEGDLSGSVTWTSSVDGSLGSGVSLVTSSLSLGTHTITASVTDGAGQPGSAPVQVEIVQNAVPTVTITAPSQDTTVAAGTPLNLVGSAADPEDGDLSGSIEWSSSTDGALGSGASLTTSSLALGWHTITASVADGAGQTATATVRVRVAQNKVPSIAITSPSQDTTVTVGDPVTLTATATDAEDGDLSGSVTWTSSLDGSLGSGASLVTSSLSLGTHTVTAAVSDAAGQERTASVVVTVTQDMPPSVTITAPSQDTTITVGDALTFAGSASDAVDGDLSASIEWTSSVDGVLGTGASVESSSLSLGTHVITANATDGAGQDGTATVEVTVTANAAPGVTITSPSQDTTIAAGDAVTLAATAADAEDGDLSGSIVWTSDRDGSLGSGASVVATSLSTGTHTITASVTDSRGATATATRGVSVATAGLDLWIDAVQLNQANQDYSGSVGGIADRSGLLRVVALASEANTAAPDVTVRVYQGGSLVLEEKLVAPGIGVPTAGGFDLADASHTWNLELPANVVGEGLSVVAEFDESLGPVDGNAGNNRYPETGEQSLDVVALTPMRVRFIPIENTNNGLVGNVSAETMQSFMDTVRTHLAVSAVEPSLGSVFSTAHDLTAAGGWSSLLADLQALRVAEGATDEYYHGIIPYSGSEPYGGLAYRPGSPLSVYRTGLSVDAAWAVREIVAHELGHNLGLPHAPGCGAAGADPEFPTADGLLDQAGWDPNRGTLVAMSSTYDLMSYCNPTFVSAHNLRKMVIWRRDDPLVAPAPAASEGLLVWGRITPSGGELNPAIPVEAPARLPSEAGSWTLRVMGEEESTLRTVSFSPTEVPHIPGERHFAFIVPLQGARSGIARGLVLSGPFGSARVAQPGPVGPAAPGEGAGVTVAAEPGSQGRARIAWDATRNPVAMVRRRSTGEILAFARGGTALVRLGSVPLTDLEVLLPDGRRLTPNAEGNRN
jgi:hypothetical protein